LLSAGRNAEAVDALKRAIRLRPDYGLALERLERAHIGLGDYDSAVEIRKSRLGIARDRDRAALLVQEKRSLGAAEALRLDVERELSDLITQSKQVDPFEQYFTTRTTADRIVAAYADLKQWKSAMDWVEMAYERRPGRVRRMLTDLPFDRRGLATDSRYNTLMIMAGAEDLI
jgi:tetratricopeptide (TPR) repeat protein